MADTFLEFMLGSFRGISEFYFEYQIIFNTIIVLFVLYQLFSNKKQDQSTS
ncbi:MULTISPECIES: hypothetical protein [Sinobaca]|uniref:Uncharacterized protein n=1 Tax=Sinobaca qinghaiensis TaxID=342944 RepID=A0A419UX71_9BACL|nr:MULTISPECIES: hypothetical protein [Sinobaca]RKD69714.1 hypothetical protein ATL39_3141 [Sinobaca qinghaiensis]